MSNIKCPVCGALCKSSLTACDTCGGILPAQVPSQPSGFGQSSVDQSAGFGSQVAPQVGFGQGGFGQPPAQGGLGQGGFGQPPAQGGFGQPPAQGGFGAQPEVMGGFGAQPVSGFGSQPLQEGLGQPVSGFGAQPMAGFGAQSPQGGFSNAGLNQEPAETGFGVTPSFTAPPSYEAKQTNVMGGMTAEATRFAATVSEGATDSIYWSFKDCLLFMLKGLIPFYGVVLLIMCMVGNPRKYPKVITNYVRAALVFTVVLFVLSFVLMLALGIGAMNSLTSLGG